jgi:hypothetical protein
METVDMRKALIGALAGLTLVLVPSAVASPTLRLSIIHVMRGCHVWGTEDSRPLGAAHTVTLKRGAHIEIRNSCPMAFDMSQLSGPALRGGLGRWETGTTHTLVFARVGLYRLKAVNVQSSAEMNLQTLGPDNTPVLTVRVR